MYDKYHINCYYTFPISYNEVSHFATLSSCSWKILTNLDIYVQMGSDHNAEIHINGMENKDAIVRKHRA